MKNAHGYRPITNKAELIKHLLDQHTDTVFGGRPSLELEPVSVLIESHRAGHFGAPGKKRPMTADRPLPVLQGLMDDMLGGGR